MHLQQIACLQQLHHAVDIFIVFQQLQHFYDVRVVELLQTVQLLLEQVEVAILFGHLRLGDYFDGHRDFTWPVHGLKNSAESSFSQFGGQFVLLFEVGAWLYRLVVLKVDLFLEVFGFAAHGSLTAF